MPCFAPLHFSIVRFLNSWLLPVVMAKRVGTTRRKTRQLMSKQRTERGKLHVSRYMQHFEIGDKVVFKAEAQYHKGLPHLRFYGHPGIVMGKKGRCYEILIDDQGQKKMLIAHPVHLLRIKDAS